MKNKNNKLIFMAILASLVSTSSFAAGNPFDKEPTPEMIEASKKANERNNIPSDIPQMAQERVNASESLRREMENAANLQKRYGNSNGSILGGIATEDDILEVKAIVNGKILEYNTGTKSYTLMEQN